MTCRELIEFLDDYLSQNQPPEVRAVFERHLAVCSACRDYLRTYRDSVHLVRASCADSNDELPGDVPETLVRAVLAARKTMK